MQASLAARQLHESLRLLHMRVLQATSQLRAPSPVSGSRSSSSSSSSCNSRARLQQAPASTGHLAASPGARRGVRSFVTSVQGSSTDGRDRQPLQPALYVVGTPIGNLEDMGFRAIRILQNVNLILAEDTRHTRKLLDHYDIHTPTLSCHEHNERQRQELVLRRLQQGEPIALVSDAGMPAISDPGAVLVAAAVAAGIQVVPVPGPCAAIAALAAAGLPTDSFYFAGFLPPKTGKRKAALQQLQALPATLVFYAPPHGLGAIASDLVDVFGPNRQAVVARELTKLHEEFFRGSLQQVLQEFGPEGNRAVKGEIVLLVAGCTAEEQQYMTMSAAAAGGGVGPSFDSSDTSQQSREALVKQLVLKELALGKSVSATAKLLSQQLQIPRSKVYKLALELAGQQDQPEQS